MQTTLGVVSNVLVETIETIQGELKNTMAKNVLMGGGWNSNRVFFTEKRFYYKNKNLIGNVTLRFHLMVDAKNLY